MRYLFPIILFVLILLYVISPYDLLPDIFPFLGWIDDTALLAILFYYLRNGRFPDFLTRFFRNLLGGQPGGTRHSHSNGFQEKTYRETGKSGSPGDGSPHAVLGVRPNASKDEIHSAYRRLVHQYHPDKVSHLGAEFQELARQKFVEIQNAYESLTGKRP